MARRKVKNKEQTFEVSQNELQDYYSRYLPQYGPGGPFAATNPLFKLMNLGNKISNFKNVSNKDIKAKDYMKFSLTNTAKPGDLSGDEPEFLLNEDGTPQVGEDGKKIPNPLYDTGNRYLSMDEKNNPVMLTYGQNRAKLLNPTFGAESERVKSGRFSARRINPVTGRVEYVNPDESSRTSGDIAEDELQAYNAESFNFDENNNVVSWNTTKYNDLNEPVELVTNPYDVNNPYNIKESHGEQQDINNLYKKNTEPVVNDNDGTPKTQKEINEEYLKNINKDIDNTTKTDAKYGGQLPKADEGEEFLGSGPIDWSAQFDEADLQGELEAQAENYGIANVADIDPTTGTPTVGSLSAYGEVWSGEGWDDVEGVTPTTDDFKVDDMAWHNDVLVPEAGGSAFVQDDYVTGDGQGDLTLGKDKMKLAEKNLKVKNKADKKAERLANKQQRAKKRKMWGDNLAQQATNFGNYAFDKMANSKTVAALDIVHDSASIYTDVMDNREAQRMQNKKFQGMNTIDNLVDPLEANAEGTRGNYDTNTGLLRIDDAVVSELARDGKELKKYQGEFTPSEVQQMQEMMKNNQHTIGPYTPKNFFPTLGWNADFLSASDDGSLNPLSVNWEGGWQDALGMHNPQTYMIPGLNTKTGEWGEEEYNTSFMNEWNRTGVEPTFTFTSAGGPGGGFRTYFPYSDPLGVGWEFDLDPTGPGTGILLNTGKLREWSNDLADAIGDNSVGNWFKDMNLPPGFLYGGVEVAGNVPAPFVGATVTLDDTENLEHWLQLPENEGKSNFARAFMHGMGPGLHAWNMPSKLSGQMTIHNPFNVMGEPLWKSPDLFGGRKIHNPFSGTGTGIAGRTGLAGGNVIPHVEIGPLEQSLRGGFASIKDEVAELAEELMKKNKNLTQSAAMKQAYSETAGKVNVGKIFDKLKVPQILDYAGEMIYGAPGSGVTAPYEKSGNTLANYLKNSKFNYGKFINNPWFWKTIARGLMVPDIMNTVTGAMHQENQPISDAWEGVFGEDPRNPAMEKYGAFPRMQRWWNEGIDPIFGAQWWDSNEEIADEKSNITSNLYDINNNKQNKTITVKHGNKKIKINPDKQYTYVSEDGSPTEGIYENFYNRKGELVPILWDAGYENATIGGKSINLQPKNSNSSYVDKDPLTGQALYGDFSYLDKNDEWVDLWTNNPVALTKSVKSTGKEYKNKKKTEEQNRQYKRTEMHIKNPYLTPKYQTGGEPESLTSLRRFTDELPTEIGYSEDDILNQKLSLAQMKNGGSNICPVCGKLKSQCGCNYRTGGDLPKAQFGYVNSRDGKSNLEQSLKLAGTVGLGSMLTRGLNTGITNRKNYKNAYNDYISNQGSGWYDEMCTEQGCPSWEANRLELLDGHSEPDFSWFRGTDVFGKQNVMNNNNVLQKGDLADAYWQNVKQGVKDGLYTGAINYAANYLTDRTRPGRKVKNWWQDHNLPTINFGYLSRKDGGEQVDVDEQMLQELIAAGADIEIL